MNEDNKLSERHHLFFSKNKKGKPIACIFSIRHNKSKIQKRFNFDKHGGKEKAIFAAKKYRDNYIKKHKISLKGRYNTSGISGVNKTIDNRTGAKYWQASWIVNGKQKTVRFPCYTLGDGEAKRLAIKAREAALSALADKEISTFIPPEKKSIKIWRYMDFTKFVSLILHNGLFFPQVDLLGDPFEGSYSRGNQKIRDFVYSKSEGVRKLEDLISKIKEKRKYICVNCWHMSTHESAAMWKLYAKTNEAICIQTTYRKLRYFLDKEVKIGIVKYINFERDWIPETDIYYPFLYKRISFKHENELRAIIDISARKQLNFNTDIEIERFGGVWKKGNLKSLISDIYISPDSPDWFEDIVKKFVNTFGFKDPIRSTLDAKPLY